VQRRWGKGRRSNSSKKTKRADKNEEYSKTHGNVGRPLKEWSYWAYRLRGAGGHRKRVHHGPVDERGKGCPTATAKAPAATMATELRPRLRCSKRLE